jgi:hypothetical protein
MKAILFGLIIGVMISCTDSEKYYSMCVLENSNNIILDVNKDSCKCLARNLKQNEIEQIKNTLNGNLKIIDHKIISSSFHLILFQDGLRMGDIFVDQNEGNIAKYIDSDTEVTFLIDSDLNQLFTDFTNLNNYDCSKNRLSIILDSITVNEYIDILKIQNPIPYGIYILNTSGNAPNNWITKRDIAQMISLIDSQARTYCIMQMISSNMPDLLEYSTLGGQIMNLIDSYRFNKKYPYFLTDCSKNDDMRKKEIIEWWGNNN